MFQKDDTRCNRPWRQPGGIYDPNTVAEYLRVNPEQIREFEESYRKNAIDWKKDKNNLFEYNSRETNSKSTSAMQIMSDEENEKLSEIKNRVTERLIGSTSCCIHIKDSSIIRGVLLPEAFDPVTKDELMGLDTSVRPMCTDDLVMKDVQSSAGLDLLQMWIYYEQEKDPNKKMMLYHHIRQGMDILDLDEILYSMLDQNPNAMSHWLPEIACANARSGSFFRIPDTRIVKVPLPILQLTRLSYESINQTTKDIVNEWAKSVFHLQKDKHYFIKTGTYSSKFDFRNAKVANEKEVMEIGEYLLFIQYQAQQMASPLSHPVIYGASTTNEWVVRGYIEDVENNPTIYKGLPLHTEYRIFADFDNKKILGIAPYWEPELMKKRFAEGIKSSPHDYHDYVIYKAHEPILMARYNASKDKVLNGAKGLLDAGLSGQWSIDIMQNGDDFWLIDMAAADSSALNDCVKDVKIQKTETDWMAGVRNVLGTGTSLPSD